MAVANGFGKTVTSGSVFMYDTGDTVNSFRGKPTTNFFTNGHFSGGTGISQEGGSNATNDIIYLPSNPGASQYVLRQTMGYAYTEYQINLTTQLQANTTYVMSGWYAESLDYVGESRMFHSRAFSTSGAHNAIGVGIGTVLATKEVGGLIWKYCYATITTPADYNNDFNWYVGYGGSNYTGARYYTNLMMEQGTMPSQFVNGTRSTTQGLLPIVGNSTITLSNMSYDSNAQMTFDGTDDKINCGTFSVPYLTVSTWVYKTASTTNQGICRKESGWAVSQYNGTLQVAPGTSWNFYDTGYVIPLNTWVNIAYTYSGTGGSDSQSVYINGNRIFTNSNGSGPITSNSNTVNVGYDDNNWFWNGYIANTIIYNRALTAAEVKQNYNKYKTRFNLS